MARRIGDYEVVHGSNDLTRDAYLARTDAGEHVMLALFHIEASERRALEQEVERAKRLRHPSVMRPQNVFVHEESTAIVFEHVTGVTLSMLSEHLHEEGERIADGAAMYITREVLGALIEGHRATGKGNALVHPRLEPEQVVITWDGGVKLVGLGLSPIYQVATERGWWPAQSRSFAAPEVRSGSAIKPMANLYSTALMLWSVLTQREPPTAGRPLAIARLRPDLDASLARAIDGALAPTPSSRFVAEQKLVQYLGGRVTSHDREELRWNMEVLRALLVVDDLVSSTALPPTRSRAVMQSLPPASGGATSRHVRGQVVADDDDERISAGPTRRQPLPLTPEERDPLSSESDMSTPQFHRMHELASSDLIEVPEAAVPFDSAVLAELPVGARVNPVIGFLKRAKSSYPPMPEVFPARPVLTVIAVAVTLAFACGVLVGRFSVHVGPAADGSRAAPMPAAPSASAATPPKASATEDPVPSATASASAAAVALAASAAALPPHQALLIVEPAVDDAFVYVNGRYMGPMTEPVAVPCGARFVRLGTRPLRKWFGKGRVITMRCREVTRATLETN